MQTGLIRQSTQVDCLEVILSNLTEDFMVKSKDGGYKLAVPHNILRGVSNLPNGINKVKTEALVGLFLKCQQVFLYEDEYETGYSINNEEDLKVAFNDFNEYVKANLGSEYENLAITENPMNTLSELCIKSYIEQGNLDCRSVVHINGHYKNGETLEETQRGRRNIEVILNNSTKEIQDYTVNVDGITEATFNSFNTNTMSGIKLSALSFNKLQN